MTFSKLTFNILLVTLAIQTSCFSFQSKDSISLTQINIYPENIVFNAPGQNPEGIEYNQQSNTFYLSAINPNPSIISVNFDGGVTAFSNDKESPSRASFGLEVDLKNNRLLACVNRKKIGNINIYNLKTGDLEHVVNLSTLLPEKNRHQINDLTIDDKNNIYASGRLEDAIYKIDKELNPSVFFQKDGYTKPNGIVYHPDGFLLVSFSHQNSSLVKIPIDNPKAAEIVLINNFDFKGFDGMLLNEKGCLVVVAFAPDNNGDNFVLELNSNDNWKTASILNSKKTKKSTTIAQVKPNVYYVINQDWKDKTSENWTLEKVEFK